MTTITLSLVSHTNAGKTTLARTLLGRDVGEVRDAPHVTTLAETFPLVETADSDALLLADTPGFGDSARLARRLGQEGNPAGWFLTQVWDRFRDRAFYLTQLAVRNVRDEADVVLYLVNAAEDPVDAGYLGPELAVLAWVQKPVLVLLNQTGTPRAPAAEAAEAARWRAVLAGHAQVRDVLVLDAFTRCWPQEFALLDAIGALVPADKADAFAHLAQAWRTQRLAVFDTAMRAIARPVAAAACARVVVPRPAMLRRVGAAIGIAGDAARGDEARAAAALARDLAANMRTAMDELVAIHGLAGRAAADVEARFERDIAREGPVDEGKAAAMGGVLSGAAAGLAADLAAGGLTFGAGILTGAVLGALGGAGVARAVNVARGQTDDALRFDAAFLLRLVEVVLLRYLAIAHYGRGRGDYEERESPAFWREHVQEAVAARRDEWSAALATADGATDATQVADRVAALLRETTLALLATFYPDARLEVTTAGTPATAGDAQR
ncbi:MAG: DUF3482 domain-containing protein [Burkholderiales bacterium]|nr:DUF3482 domain-containing protein [Burkholderiales bacterium]